jgi:hypothetical protein
VAAGDLTTLANAKQWLNLTTSNDDALLSRLVTAASQFIQTWLCRQIAQSTYAETRNGDGGTRLAFANMPTTAVQAVTVDGTAILPAVSPLAAGYLFDARCLYLNGYAFNRGYQNVTLVYTAGYAATPPEVEQACIELVALRYREREHIGQASKGLAGESVSFAQKDMSDDIRTALMLYRKVIPQ